VAQQAEIATAQGFDQQRGVAGIVHGIAQRHLARQSVAQPRLVVGQQRQRHHHTERRDLDRTVEQPIWPFGAHAQPAAYGRHDGGRLRGQLSGELDQLLALEWAAQQVIRPHQAAHDQRGSRAESRVERDRVGAYHIQSGRGLLQRLEETDGRGHHRVVDVLRQDARALAAHFDPQPVIVGQAHLDHVAQIQRQPQDIQARTDIRADGGDGHVHFVHRACRLIRRAGTPRQRRMGI